MIRGRGFKFGDDISTDLIAPGRYFHLRSNLPELAKHVLESAIARVIAEGRNVTYDMKPTPDDPAAVGTSQMADAIIEKIKELK